MIPDSYGMKLLRDMVDLETSRVGNVVIRNITENFWFKVIETTETTRVCALGTPGVGKTTTTCILIRLLLEMNNTVVYHVRKIKSNGYVYMFTPTRSNSLNMKINAKVIRESAFDYNDDEINQPSICYVVDPGKTKDNCDLDADFQGKVIIVASPDDRHWGGSEFEKERRGVMGTFLFFPVWNLQELIKAMPYVDSSLSEPGVEERYHEVGGIPRHIFTKNATFAKVLKRQENAINRLTEEQLRSLTLGDVESAQTFGEDQPTSSIMVYECSDPNFENNSVSVSSRRVARLLVHKHKKVLWNIILDEGGARGSTTWKLFELYCQNLMLIGYSQNYFDYKYHDGANLLEVTDLSVPALQFGNCTKIKESSDSLIDAAKRENNDHIVFYSSNKQYPLFDFIYKRKNILFAFQVSIGKDHSCKPQQLKAAMEEVGNGYEFFLHYLTFDERYDEFQLSPVNPFKDNNSIYVRSSLTNDWTIKVIRVPSPSEEKGGRSKKLVRRKVSKDQILHFLNIPIGKNRPALVEQLLNIDTGRNEQGGKILDTILQFTNSELKACLRALQLPVGGNKEKLVERLQSATELLLKLIDELRNATALTNQTQSQIENDFDTVQKYGGS